MNTKKTRMREQKRPWETRATQYNRLNLVEISFPKEVKIAGYLKSVNGWKFLKLKKNISHEIQEILKDYTGQRHK